MTGPASSAPFDPGELHPETALLAKIPIGYARRHLLLPCRTPAGDVVLLSGGKPEAREAIDEMRFLAGSTRVVCAPENEVLARIDAAYERAHSPENEIVEGLPGEWDLDPTAAIEETRDLLESPDEAPVIRFVHAVLFRAIRERSSDIHFEPYEKELVVRNRVDGILYPMITAPRKWHAPAVSRVKVMAGLDIAERRLPQDGRIKIRLGGREIDIRVSTVPTSFGERAVLRLLDKSNLELDMTKLGFETAQLVDFNDSIHRPFGMILVTGPTGSGKTTTLYSALVDLNKVADNICTAEDPVEYNFAGINQVQTKEEIGLTFAAALRSFLRQDPDIIMVGEIRDYETAEIAVKAALTGHLVLSTLHTNDAPSTVTRLLNMGIEPFLVSSSLNLIVAQRLARRVCMKCREEIKVPPKALADAGMKPERIRLAKPAKGKGCEDCSGTGFRGRVALYEVMPIKEEIKDLVLRGGSALDLQREAVRLGMKTLRQSGLTKLEEGVTTLEEVLRVTAPD